MNYQDICLTYALIIQCTALSNDELLCPAAWLISMTFVTAGKTQTTTRQTYLEEEMKLNRKTITQTVCWKHLSKMGKGTFYLAPNKLLLIICLNCKYVCRLVPLGHCCSYKIGIDTYLVIITNTAKMDNVEKIGSTFL